MGCATILPIFRASCSWSANHDGTRPWAITSSISSYSPVTCRMAFRMQRRLNAALAAGLDGSTATASRKSLARSGGTSLETGRDPPYGCTTYVDDSLSTSPSGLMLPNPPDRSFCPRPEPNDEALTFGAFHGLHSVRPVTILPHEETLPILMDANAPVGTDHVGLLATRSMEN